MPTDRSRPVRQHSVRLTAAARRLPLPVALSLSLILIVMVAGCADKPVDQAAQGSGVHAGQPPALDGTSPPPWPAPTDVPERVAEAGLDLGPMGMAEHYHPALQILIGGRAVPVPANLGVDPNTGAMSAVHTHTPDGIIHIEAATRGDVFTLGQLFVEWGVKLSSRQIGGVVAKPGQHVTVTSNGARVVGDPTNLRLRPNQQIVLRLP